MRNVRITAVLGSLLLLGMTVTAVAQNQQVLSKRDGAARQTTMQVQHANQYQIQNTNGNGPLNVSSQKARSGGQSAQAQQGAKGKNWGPGDGSGQKANPPKDGSGYGANSGKANGPQDGSGKRNGNEKETGSGNKDGSRVRRVGPQEGGAQPGNMGGSRGSRGRGRGRN